MIPFIRKLKKSIVVCCLAIMFACVLFFLDWKESLADQESGSGITLDLTYGYDNSVKGGRFIPMDLSLKNETPELFQGQVQFLAMESDRTVYRYDYPILVDQFGSLVKHVDIPLGIHIDQLFVILVNNQHEIVLKKKLKLDISQDFSDLFIGVLSDSSDQLTYLEGIGINYSMLRSKTFQLDASTFPKEEVGLNLLDVILISDYNIKALSEEQYNALLEWIDQGGLLVLGTGARVDDILVPFELQIENKNYQPRKTLVNLGLEYAVSDPGDSQVEMTCVDLTLRGGTVIFSDDQLSLVSMIRREKGAIAVAAFDFKDLSEFASIHSSYVDKLFTNLLGEEKINLLSESVYQSNTEQYWNVKELLDTGEVGRLPNLKIYVMIIVIYLVLTGPFLYLTLKQKGWNRYYLALVTVSAIIFSGLIFVISEQTRFANVFYTYATFLDVTKNAVSETTYLNIRTPDNQPYKIKLDPSYTLKPITYVDYNVETEAFKFIAAEAPDTSISYSLDSTVLAMDQVTAFTSEYFQLDRTIANENEEGFFGELLLFDNMITGTVTNHFNHTVENVMILFHEQMVLLGTLESGESIELDHVEALFYPRNQSQITAELISGSYQFQKANIDDQNYIDTQKKTNLLSFYLENHLSSYASDVKVLGICTEDNSGQFLMDNKNDVSGLTMLSSTIDVTTAQNNQVYRSGLIKKPKVISGEYDPESNVMTWGDSVVLEYSLGNDIDVEWLTFHNIAEAFQNYEAIKVFNGDMFFYNYDTGSYDQMTEQRQFEIAQLQSYLSPGNTIMVKYINDRNSSYSWNAILPTLMIIGRLD